MNERNEVNMEETDRSILLELRRDLQEVKLHLTILNGRVGRGEDWRTTQDLDHARAEGAASASSNVLFTKSQLALLSGILGIVVTLAGFLSRYVS